MKQKISFLLYGKPRYMGLIKWEEDFIDIPQGKSVIVETDRGEELALHLKTLDCMESSIPQDTCQPCRFIRVPNEDDIGLHLRNLEQESNAFFSARRFVIEHCIAMKMIDAEYTFDKKKLFFYFTAEGRVDFRELVKDLAREFKTRIEMRQIGVRDESKILGGLGPCGRTCCCNTFLKDFKPVSIKMLKEQNLAINPAKTSGICGRLMCCMRYEYNVYEELWRSLPNPGSKIKAPHGNYEVVGIDIKMARLRLYSPDSSIVNVPIDKFNDFKEKVIAGQKWENESIKPEKNHPPVSPAIVGKTEKISYGNIKTVEQQKEEKFSRFKKSNKSEEKPELKQPYDEKEQTVKTLHRQEKRKLEKKIGQEQKGREQRKEHKEQKPLKGINENKETKQIETDAPPKKKKKFFRKARSEKRVNPGSREESGE